MTSIIGASLPRVRTRDDREVLLLLPPRFGGRAEERTIGDTEAAYVDSPEGWMCSTIVRVVE